jgi:two-component system response regulator YesN
MKTERPTIYLVDDEQPVLDGLSVSLSKIFPNLKICGKARSGMEALQGIAREKPDIIIMDVRMPGMSGIDTLREVNKILPDTISILLTAYERFDIAQDAYSLGVYKYLVKPVSQEMLAKTINNALAKLEEIKSASLQIALGQERIENTRPLLEAGFIWSLVMDDPRAPLYRSFGESLGLVENGSVRGHFAVICRKKGSLDREELKAIRREITNRLDCIPGPLFGTVVPVFISGEKINRTRDVLRSALETLGLQDLRYSLGCAASDGDLRLSYSQALSGIYREEPGLLIDEYREKSDQNIQKVNSMESLPDFLKEGNFLKLRNAFAEWSLDYSGEMMIDRAIMAGALCAFLNADTEKILSAGKLQLSVKKTNTREAAEFAANLLITYLASLDDNAESGPAFHDRRIRRALLFIADHYGEQISLEDTAGFVGISPAHLSRLFSVKTGTTFSHQLAQYRIGRACKELREGILSIKEIAGICGYPDANYFSRAFKKVLGLAPSEWMEQQHKNKGKSNDS